MVSQTHAPPPPSDPSGGRTVTIVLATYNGARYLPDQLASLSGQSRKPDRLVLRDDGSVDGSVELVRAWAQQQNVALQEVVGDRLGAAGSFLAAVRAAEPADLFLFCDQDDVWEPFKIQRALDHVPTHSGAPAALYATRLEVVDEHLAHVRLSDLPRHLSFVSAACESLLTGCTMAFNESFRQLLVCALPHRPAMHDWWCYLLASGASGAVLHFDPTPTVRYRQHGANALGAGPVGVALLRQRWQRFSSGDSTLRSRQLQEFADLHGAVLTPQASAFLTQVLSARSSLPTRLRVTFTAPMHRQTRLSSLTTRLAILTNRF